MADMPDERQLVMQARSRLDQWVSRARREAYAELFEGDSPSLTDEELQLLDEIDSEMAREGAAGVWGADQYGIHVGGSTPSQDSIGVVCVYHPQITSDSVFRGADEIDDEQEERLNKALWEYCERIVALVEEQLDEFIRSMRE